MSDQQSAGKRGPASETGLGRVVLDDLKRTRLDRDYLRELKDLYRFYLDEESRTKLAAMGRLKGAFWLLGWLLKSLLMKLSPARRLSLLITLVMAIWGHPAIRVGQTIFQADLRLWAFLIVLVVLMLELKDKLLAKDEIQIARQVQIALLPSRDPEIPGWSVWNYSRPANDVGGDLVDYVELGGFRHGIALGDVAGKGLGAALLSAKLQATLRALVPESPSLDDLGARLNSILFRDGLDNRFATLFYTELEYHSGQMRYLNAGHNPAFVIRKDRLEMLQPSSFPLGMFATASYEESIVELEPGDMVLVYSDGLTEATDDGGLEYGQERVEALLGTLRNLPPEAIGGRILEDVDRFLGETKAQDDLSLVVILRQ